MATVLSSPDIPATLGNMGKALRLAFGMIMQNSVVDIYVFYLLDIWQSMDIRIFFLISTVVPRFHKAMQHE